MHDVSQHFGIAPLPSSDAQVVLALHGNCEQLTLHFDCLRSCKRALVQPEHRRRVDDAIACQEGREAIHML